MRQNTSVSIANELKNRIRSGALAPGDRIPSAREIVREWGVAIATASRVSTLLKREGLVKTRRGVGTVVRDRNHGFEVDREQVIRAAIAIADEEGFDTLSLRKVAIELGVSTARAKQVVDSYDDLVLYDVVALRAGRGEAPRSGTMDAGRLECLELACAHVRIDRDCVALPSLDARARIGLMSRDGCVLRGGQSRVGSFGFPCRWSTQRVNFSSIHAFRAARRRHARGFPPTHPAPDKRPSPVARRERIPGRKTTHRRAGVARRACA